MLRGGVGRTIYYDSRSFWEIYCFSRLRFLAIPIYSMALERIFDVD